MKQKTIKVTQRHIDDGVPENAESCPIAQALLDRTNVVEVLVDGDFATIYEHRKSGTMVRIYRLPKRAENFVTKFDTGQKVKPFSFKLGKLIREFEEKYA